MMTISFDTQQVVKLLTSHGYTPQQAEGMVEVVKELNLDKLSTKDDLEKVRLAGKEDLNTGLNMLKSELKSEIEKAKMELIIKTGGMIFISTGFLTAIKFFG